MKIIIQVITIFLISMSGFSEYQRKPVKFYHEGYKTKNLTILKEEYNFDEYCSYGKSEYERMILLKDWVFRNLKYGFVKGSQNERNALSILRKTKRGKRFLCTNFSAVYMQSALSLGWTSRYFFMRKPTGAEHAANDIWSNQFNKWIFIDTTWNIHIEKNNIPLSLIEIRSEWKRNNGKDLNYIFGAGINKKKYRYSDLPIRRNESIVWRRMPVRKNWISYTYEIALIGRNNFFSYKNGTGADIWGLIYIIRDKYNSHDKKWAFRRKKNISVKRMFHKLNKVSVRLNRENEKDYTVNFDIYNNSFTPNFHHFYVKINNGKWQIIDSPVKIIRKGESIKVKARVVNKFGVYGPITEKKLYY